MKLILHNSRANRGRWYQRLVTAACRLYDAQERAYIAEIPTPMGIAKGGEAAFFKEKAITDYFGTLRGGRSIAFDAKGSLSGSYRAGVPDHDPIMVAPDSTRSSARFQPSGRLGDALTSSPVRSPRASRK